MTDQNYGKNEHFKVYMEAPINGGTPAEILREDYITPENAFYIRTHAPTVPNIDAATYQLVIDGMVNESLSFTIDELKRDFTYKEVMATLQCAGNRRSELHKVKPLPGPGKAVMWKNEAISNGLWGGVPLVEVLNRAGIQPGAAHVAFTSLDHCEDEEVVFGYGGSIPLEKALSPEVLLVYNMNGKPLSPVHGYPLRVIVPGYVAARSVKWLGKVTVQAEMSDNFYQQHDYKVFPPDVTPENVDWSQGEMLEKMQTDALICSPTEEEVIQAGRVVVQGYAMPACDAEITKVEVSTDEGVTWHEAELKGETRRWTWQFWELTLELEPGDHTLIVRAQDTLGVAQPNSPADVWNFRGYMNTSRHRIELKVV